MSIASRRVVVTGVGIISPCGVGVETTWTNVLQGRSGIGPITAFDSSEFQTQIAGEVSGWNPRDYLPRKQIRGLGRFSEFAVVAAKMAMEDSGLQLTDEQRERTATVLGVGIGGLDGFEKTFDTLARSGPRRVSPYAIPTIAPNMAPGQVTIALGLRGPSFSTASACASSSTAIGESFEMIRSGRVDFALTGGVEAAVTPLAVAGFEALRALSKRNDEPERASRPFDVSRDGFVMGEGAGVLMLETLEHARARGAHVYAELTGYGASSDAFNSVRPGPEGLGAASAMRRALASAQLAADDIGYINAHATGTKVGDVLESQAIGRVFGERSPDHPLLVSSTKSMTGHLLGAAGAVEAIFCALACDTGDIPPTSNLDEQDPTCDVSVVGPSMAHRRIAHALSNSFGFGGSNVALAFSRFEN